MKKLLTAVLAVVMTLTITACGNQTADQPTPGSGGENTDFQKNMASQSFRCAPVCETESGYYFIYDMFLYYMEKDTCAITILCGKPDCTHRDTNCNAFVNPGDLTYYDGKLYYTNGDAGVKTLYSMELDGTKRTAVQTLEAKTKNQYSSRTIVHRGYVYFVDSSAIYAAPLGKDFADAKKIYGEAQITESFAQGDLTWTLWADGDYLYFMGNITLSDKTQKDTLFCYDPAAKKVTQVWETPSAAEVGQWETTGVSVGNWSIMDGYIYYYLSGNDLWRGNLATGENERLAAVSEKTQSGTAFFDHEYAFILNTSKGQYTDMMSGQKVHTGGDTLYIYRLDGSFVSEISVQDGYQKLGDPAQYEAAYGSVKSEFVCVSNGKVFLLASAEAPLMGYITNQLYYADIASGKVTLVENWPGLR